MCTRPIRSLESAVPRVLGRDISSYKHTDTQMNVGRRSRARSTSTPDRIVNCDCFFSYKICSRYLSRPAGSCVLRRTFIVCIYIFVHAAQLAEYDHNYARSSLLLGFTYFLGVSHSRNFGGFCLLCEDLLANSLSSVDSPSLDRPHTCCDWLIGGERF